MSILVVTDEQRELIEAAMVKMNDALGYGVSDGSTTFIEAVTNYLDGPRGLTEALRVKTKQFLAVAVAALLQGAAETPASPFLSEAQYGLACGANFTASSSASNASGCTFLVTGRPMSATGATFWWDGNGTATVRCSLWDGVANTLLTSADVAVTAAGIYTATFVSPIALSSFREYRMTKFDLSDATHQWYATNANISAQTSALMTAANFFVQAGGWLRTGACYAASGDVFPDQDSATTINFVDPVLV